MSIFGFSAGGTADVQETEQSENMDCCAAIAEKAKVITNE
jgi:hypothetical protein